MTTVAWDGKTLSGDTRITINGYVDTDHYIKVKKFTVNKQEMLVGVTNLIQDMDRFMKWAESNFASSEYEESQFEPTFSAIVIYKGSPGNDHNIQIFENNEFFDYPSGKAALGSGAFLAKMAMMYGKNSKSAVIGASNFDTGTNNKVVTVSFED